jgi:hypothetical protein
MRVSPTLVEDLLDVVGRPYDGVDHVVLDDIHEAMLDLLYTVQIAYPGRGDCWILKIAHAPSPKNLSKNGLTQKGGSLSVEGVLQKKISGAGEDFDRIDGPMSACGHVTADPTCPL